MRKVLVTGANGFVGSHICEALLDAGFDVRALVRKTSDLANIKGLPIQFAYGDLNDTASLPSAVDGVDVVINNAGLTKAIHPDEFERVNAVGTGNILKSIAEHNPGLRCFVQISSTAACGPAPSATPINEDHPLNPLTAYGRSKLKSERIAVSYKDKFPVVVLRPSAVYGPRDKEMLSFFKTVKFGIKPTFGRGESYINFTYVKDLALAVAKTAKAEHISSGIYFVLERKAYTYSEAGGIISSILGRKAIGISIPSSILSLAGKITEVIARLQKKPSIFTADKAREITQKFWLFDSSKIERELGFTAPTDFKSGVIETIAWYKKEGWL
jgi:nucleoside-diphosphate-sugar epimerase